MNRFNRAVLITAFSAIAATSLSGCIIVAVDRESGEGSWSSSSSSRRARAIGVNLADVAPATAAQAGVDPSRACVVTDVWTNSAADRAGLKKWDVVTSIDGKDWATADALRDAIRARKGGDTLRLSVVRAGQRIETTVTLPGE